MTLFNNLDGGDDDDDESIIELPECAL